MEGGKLPPARLRSCRLCRARSPVSADLPYIGYALWAIGDLTRDRSNYDAAFTHFAKSYEIARAAAGAEPTNTQAQRSLATSLSNLGEKEAFLGNPAAGDHNLEALEVLQKIADTDPANLEGQRDVAEVQLLVSAACRQLSERDEARTHSRIAAEILERVQQLDPASAETATLLDRARQQMKALQSPAP